MVKRTGLSQKIEKLIIQFDSSTAFLHALAYFFHSENFKAVGMAEGVPAWVGKIINSIPKNIRASLYSWSGWLDAIKQKDLSLIDMEEVSAWAVSLYPVKKYPGFMFGSSNGAAMHLAAALGFAWLPQTYLIAIRRFLGVDELKKDVDWGSCAIGKFLRDNPNLLFHQMHDPVQDRLMVDKMGYFRVKRLDLGRTFENFIINQRGKGAFLLIVNCDYSWPSYRVSERHLFQTGGYGGIEPYEYLNGSQQVSNFLKKMGSPLKKWEMYPPSGEFPEAEWGFARQALPALRNFAKKNKIPLVELEFSHPESLSHFTVDLYEWWYQKRKRRPERLLIESFGLVAPLDAIESSSLPFWLAFNTRNSYENVRQYLETHAKFKEILAMLMSNGVPGSIGLVDIKQWKLLFKKARTGSFIGVDEKQYPLDFATFLKYHSDLARKLIPRDSLPEALTLEELKEFIKNSPRKYKISWRF